MSSKPLSISQAGRRLIKINKGRPEVKPVKKQMMTFLVRKFFNKLVGFTIFYFETNLYKARAPNRLGKIFTDFLAVNIFRSVILNRYF